MASVAQRQQVVVIQRQVRALPAAQDMVHVHLATSLAALTATVAIAPQDQPADARPGGGAVERVDALGGAAVHTPIQIDECGAE